MSEWRQVGLVFGFLFSAGFVVRLGWQIAGWATSAIFPDVAVSITNNLHGVSTRPSTDEERDD